MIIPLGGDIEIDIGAIVVPILINHYSGVEDVDWHVRLQVTTYDDPAFSSRLTDLDKDSSADQSDWFWRDEQTNASDRNVQAIAAGGISTKLSKAQANGLVATAFYPFNAADELALLEWGRLYLVRASQYNGAAWGDWAAWPVRAGVSVGL
jgi:hypothetical protein